MSETSAGAPDDVNAPLPDQRWTVQWADGPVPNHRRLRSLTGHSAPVRSVATAVVDGRAVVVSGSRDTTVRFWDLATGEQLHAPVTGRTDPVSSMTTGVLSVATAEADGRPVALTLHEDDSVLAWDLATGRAAGEFVRLVESTVLEGRRVLLTLGADGTLGAWDLLTGSRVGAFPSAAGLAVLEGRRVVLTVDDIAVDRTVRVWDLGTGEQLARSVEVERTLTLDGRVLAVTAGEAGTAEAEAEAEAEPRLWDLATGEPVPAPSAAAALSRGTEVGGVSTATVVHGRLVAVGLDGEEPRFIGPLALARQNGALARHRARETALLDGRTVALTAGADEDGTLRIWDLADDGQQRVTGIRVIRSVGAGEAAPVLPHEPERAGDLWQRLSGRPTGTGNAPVAVVGGRGDRIALTVEADGTVAVRDRATGRPVGPPLTGHTGKVQDVATTALAGRPVAVTAGADHTIRTWDLTHVQGDGPPRSGHTGTVCALTTGVLDGTPVAVTAGADHAVRVWDLAAGQQVTAPVTGLEGEVTAMVTVVVDGRMLVVTAGCGDALGLLDPVGGHPHESVTTGQGRVLALATATLTGRPVLVTAGADRTVAVWDPATRRAVGEPLTGHSSRVTSVATVELAGRPVAVTGSWDRTVRVWDLTDGRQLGEPLTGHTDWVTSVATVLVDGRPAAVSRSRDKTVCLWDLATMRQIGGARTGHADPNGPMAVTGAGAGAGLPVVAVGQGQTVRCWDLATGHEAGNEYVLPLAVGALGAAPGGRLVVGFGPEVALLRPAAD